MPSDRAQTSRVTEKTPPDLLAIKPNQIPCPSAALKAQKANGSPHVAALLCVATLLQLDHRRAGTRPLLNLQAQQIDRAVRPHRHAQLPTANAVLQDHRRCRHAEEVCAARSRMPLEDGSLVSAAPLSRFRQARTGRAARSQGSRPSSAGCLGGFRLPRASSGIQSGHPLPDLRVRVHAPVRSLSAAALVAPEREAAEFELEGLSDDASDIEATGPTLSDRGSVERRSSHMAADERVDPERRRARFVRPKLELSATEEQQEPRGF